MAKKVILEWRGEKNSEFTFSTVVSHSIYTKQKLPW